MTRVLVTGGAGYIGSHVVKHLAASGFAPVTLDNLYAGHRWAVTSGELIEADFGDPERMDAILGSGRFEAIIHMAAHIWVGESGKDPAKYYQNNTVGALNLFRIAARHGIRRIVFSSTAAVYGEPDLDPIPEDAPLRPINPYGASKMMAERILADVMAASGGSWMALRYFNVAGADPDGQVGEATPNNSHLVKLACMTAAGLRPRMAIFGRDYPTPDGTCIRDYVHVQDLARAHVDALRHLLDGGASMPLNCGYGHGFSVKEVLDTCRRITGVDFPIVDEPRRPGDPARLVADGRRIREVLGFEPRFDDLDTIVAHAWAWERKLAAMRGA
ncbi:UDP-glucose 4-epimerase GalE [Geminicoccus roseus]|uniref:UDP-glucose 4-epimerase GalE n=1 Tax=Geminicoccus roseus TaxID=404900 RepID=UPI0004002B94|nr:UDP-glucose 4-epimerase GalE [Geminicoccus roseus]